jgi:biopolymer transport protein ExbD
MRNLRSQNKVKAEGGSSAMTDLVFLLLIFFIIISTMVSNPNMKLDLPSATAPVKPPEKNEVIKVSVTNENKFYVGNEGIPVTLEKLEGAIMNQVLTTGDSIVELSGDKASNWEYNINVIDVAKKNQLKLVIKTKM